MRLNWRTVKKKKEMCRKRDGDVCLIDYCMTGDEYRAKYKKDFDLHHIDEDTENNADDNLCLAAHKCNVGETPRGKGRFSRERIDETLNSLNLKKKRSAIDKDIYTNEAGLRIDNLSLFRNVKLKPLAVREFEKIIDEKKEVEREGLIDAMANISGLTQDKCRQYLKAITNPHNGEYEEFTKDEKKYIRKRES
jgi:hypothetical protein